MWQKLAKRLAVFLCALGFATLAAGADLALSEQDRNFIAKAAAAGHTEVMAGKLAPFSSQNPELLKFASERVAILSQAGTELTQIADSKGIQAPSDPNAKQSRDLEKLKNAKGDEFDRLYAQIIGINAHKDVLALFRSQAKDGKDPQLKAFAQRTLPMIEQQYKTAEGLHRSLALLGK